MNKIKLFLQHKWNFRWVVFFLLVAALVVFEALVTSRKELNSVVIQLMAILFPVASAVLIMMQNNEQIAKSTLDQLDSLKKMNDLEIAEMQKLFQQQISALSESTNRQIEESRKLTTEQINALHVSTEKQIEAYGQHSQTLAKELTANSIFLSEILKRELEKALSLANQQIQMIENKLKDSKSFKVLRTEDEKNRQIRYWSNLLQEWTIWKNSILTKHVEVCNKFNKV